MTNWNSDTPWLGATRSPWLDDTSAWLREKLEGNGFLPPFDVSCVHDRPWSIILRATSAQGAAYFKAAAPGGRHEPGLVRALAAQWSDRVPAPLAVDTKRGWLVLPDLGRTLRQELDGADGMDTWLFLLPRYAEIQLASSLETAGFLRLGVPDRRLQRLPGLLRKLARDDRALCLGRSGGLLPGERDSLLELLPDLEACCRELASMPCPAALEHGDLQDANILVRDGAYWFCDWADASIAHPFLSLLVTCRRLVDDFASSDGIRRFARLRDAYLEPWSKLAPARSLRPLFGAALWVAHLACALDWNHMLAGVSESAREEWQTRVPKWLRLWREGRGLFTKSARRFA
ncbi:MAG TPA: phosphotransferase [Myxococcota bacterium]|nr:phosphotransferase [Myxococcota bacterium]